MLPNRFSPTGTYNQRTLDRARGYRVLAHAEIESFIEDITLGAAKSAMAEWVRSRKPSDLIICLLAHYHDGYNVDGVDIFPLSSRPKTKESIKQTVQIALNQYISIHNDNHGVREENLMKMLLPIGVRRDDLDETWITNLNEFGKRRGEVAHKAVKVQQQIDPLAEFNDVKSLLAGLDKLDRLVQFASK
jgi:hypothetical protein